MGHKQNCASGIWKELLHSLLIWFSLLLTYPSVFLLGYRLMASTVAVKTIAHSCNKQIAHLLLHMLCNSALLSFHSWLSHEYFPLSSNVLSRYYLDCTRAIMLNGYTTVYKAIFLHYESFSLHHLNCRYWKFQIAMACHMLQLGVTTWIDPDPNALWVSEDMTDGYGAWDTVMFCQKL